MQNNIKQTLLGFWLHIRHRFKQTKPYFCKQGEVELCQLPCVKAQRHSFDNKYVDPNYSEKGAYS